MTDSEFIFINLLQENNFDMDETIGDLKMIGEELPHLGFLYNELKELVNFLEVQDY